MLGISTDTQNDNLLFKQQHSFPFPLLCDTDGTVTYAYGAAGIKKAYMANRISYLIDENGIIARTFRNVVPANHADELLELLS